MRSAEDYADDLRTGCCRMEGGTLRVNNDAVVSLILAIQSDARESALREALHYIKLSLPEKLPKRSRPNTKHRLAEIIASLIPEAGK